MAAPPLSPPPAGPTLPRWLNQLWSRIARVALTPDGPSVTTGAGVPAETQPNGSLYLRTDGTGPNLYVRENGAWVAK